MIVELPHENLSLRFLTRSDTNLAVQQRQKNGYRAADLPAQLIYALIFKYANACLLVTQLSYDTGFQVLHEN